MAEVPLLGTNQQTQDSQESGPKFIEAKTAFLVIVQEDGSVKVETDVDTPVVLDRAPSINEIYSACGIIRKDVEREESVAQTIGMLDMMGRRQMEMMQSAQLAQKLHLK